MGACGRNCSLCEFFACDLCRGCLNGAKLCAAFRCSLGEYIVGLDFDCGKCGFAEFCPKTRKEAPKLGVKLLLEQLECKPIARKRLGDLPAFIPTVLLGEEPVWNDVDGVKAIIVRYPDLLKQSAMMDKVCRRGLHSAFNFGGSIILSSVMEDELLVMPDTFSKFMDIVKVFDFDGVIGWDMPVYEDQPLFMSWRNLLAALQNTVKLAELGKPVVGLVKGGHWNQIEFSTKFLTEVGIRDLALYFSEYVTAERVDFGNLVLQQMSKNAERVIALGVSDPTVIQQLFLIVPSASFSGSDWFTRAKKFNVFSEIGAVDLKSKSVYCQCKSCKTFGVNNTLSDFKHRALHNLELAFKASRGESFSTRLYDLIIENQRAIIVSNLHIGTPESMYENCLSFLHDEKPDVVIFLGDTFDFKHGHVRLQHLMKFFQALRAVKCQVVPTFGSVDNSFEQIKKCAKRFIFNLGKHPRAGLFEPIPDSQYDLFLLLLRFYSLAKRELMIRLPDGTLMEAFHGELMGNFVKKPSQLENPIKLMEHLPREEGALLVTGYTHYAGINLEKGLISVGCWQQPTPEMKKKGLLNPDIGAVLVIEKDGSLRLVDAFEG